MTNLFKFQKTISEIKELLLRHQTCSKEKELNFKNSILNFKKASNAVYSQRIKETQHLIDQNPEMLQLSTFELMEHNFRENTHSNILRYLFDYRFLEESAANILSNFLKEYNNSIDNLGEKIKQKKYIIEREKSTGKGRIDILIYDKENEFVIVIENKLLASISLAKGEIEGDVSLTQLNNYKEYIENTFKNYQKLYIILSYRLIDNVYAPFEVASYQYLYEVIKAIDLPNVILEEYKLLLHSIINNINNKEWLIETASNILNNKDKQVSFNTLENINKLVTI